MLLTSVPLYEDQQMTVPKWLVHPIHKEKVDVVAIPVTRNSELHYFPINEIDFDSHIGPEVGDDCFIIGFPFPEFRYLGLPILKRGSIATEPTANEGHLPKLLVDTATRSGSPVIYQRTGIHNIPDGQLLDDTIFGTIRGFLGVYSGRIGQGEIQAQLGIIWKKEVIEEIISGDIIGDIGFQSRGFT